jgi:transcriptional regulator with XRE-family HTH domain
MDMSDREQTGTPTGVGAAERPPAVRLARSLRRLRARQAISLNQLARRSGVSTATLSGLEAGRGNPTMATLLALAPALGVSAADLLPEGRSGRPLVTAEPDGHDTRARRPGC